MRDKISSDFNPEPPNPIRGLEPESPEQSIKESEIKEFAFIFDSLMLCPGDSGSNHVLGLEAPGLR